MRTVTVPLDERSYPIMIGSGLFNDIGKYCSKAKLGRRCAVVTDSNVGPLFASKVQTSLKKAGFELVVITVKAGETSKNLKTVQACYDKLATFRLERNSFIVALGGGVVGDLAGFLAATYLRGIPFVQVPTTLLAQVDSSVGGKVGVNLKAGKNLVGAFYQPRFVLCDLDAFKSLPKREFRAGLAEVIKYGIIYDAPLFACLERDLPQILKRDPSVMAAVVARCCQIKAEVVCQDEKEGGLRAILNFGHTLGHAIEAVAGYGKYLHGEALAIGSVAAARLSAQVTGLPEKDVARIESLLVKTGLPTKFEFTPAQRKKIVAATRLDKKVSQGEVKFVLARKIGQVEYGQKVNQKLVEQVVG